MNCLNLLLFIFCFTIPTRAEEPKFRKDFIYLPETGAFYKYHKGMTTFSYAVETCSMEGATLFFPTSENETQMVRDRIIKTDDVIWMGAHNFHTGGPFITLSGDFIEDVYPNWQEYNHNDFYNCITVTNATSFSFVDCRWVYKYICKRNANNIPRNELCETHDKKYFYEPRHGHPDKCYKIHKKPKSWRKAYLTCKHEESSLVVINDEKEAEMLTEKLAGLLNITSEKRFIHVGFNDFIVENEYETVDGKSLLEAGYEKWALGQPDGDTKGEQDCGAMDKDGLLRDVDCNLPALFVCEKKVDNCHIKDCVDIIPR